MNTGRQRAELLMEVPFIPDPFIFPDVFQDPFYCISLTRRFTAFTTHLTCLKTAKLRTGHVTPTVAVVSLA